MNLDYLQKKIRPFVVNNQLTYDDFDKIFGQLPRKEQYPICDAVQDDLHVELVDELDEPPVEDVPAEVAPLIVRQPHEIKVPNKFLIRLIQDGDEQARQDLCIKNSGLVGKYAVQLAKKYTSKLELVDLMQEGFVGMLRAAERFDFAKGTAFSTYAVYWIKQAIERAIFDTGYTVRLPVHIIEKVNKATKLDKALQLRDIGLRERLNLIAQEMNITAEDVRELFRLRDVYTHMASLDMPVGEDSDTPLAELIISDENPTDDAVTLVLMREQIDAILTTLSQRERAVLSLRFGLLDGHERTLEAVGKIFNVTRERIRQIEDKALRKLRHPARSKKLRDFL
ncbi:MAG: sigma-70 family RNA polymerase sigma factor [Quinella sp. 1Q7]|nr:sigma-70 family RNA polymerase sigma factor [Quinella sp. 1Q7]